MIRLDKLEIRRLDDQTIQGTTSSGEPSEGLATRWEAVGPPGVKLILQDVTWKNTERDVRALEAEGPLPTEVGGPRPIARLTRGGRLSVLKTGHKYYVELQVSKIKPDSPELWSSRYKASEEDFDLLDPSWKESLLAAGATTVNRRKSALGDQSNHKDYLCAVMKSEQVVLPIVAYSLTRILPLLNIWSPLHEARRTLTNQRRVYVVALDEGVHPAGARNKCLYVGETGRSPEERFTTHKEGGRTASRVVTQHGISLMQKLYEHIPPVGHEQHRVAQQLSSRVEKWLKSCLEDDGYCVHGGTRGIDEAPFTQPPS